MSEPKRILKTYSRAKRKFGEATPCIVKRKRVEDSMVLRDETEITNTQQTPIRRRLHSGTELETFPSSDSAIYSEGDYNAATPPSSPPPLHVDNDTSYDLENRITPCDAEAREGRKPFNTVSGNAQITSFFQAKPEKAPPTQPQPQQKLVQMQLNLGPTSQKDCKVCGMTYVPANLEDSTLHNTFHQKNVGGIDLGRAFRKSQEPAAIWKGHNNDVVVAVEVAERWQTRRKVRSVLDVVGRELGCVDIPDLELVTMVALPLKWDDPPRAVFDLIGRQKPSDPDPFLPYTTPRRYQVFLYMSGTKCIGLCLAERISRAYKVLDPQEAGHNALVVSEVPSQAFIGISRIWTSTSHRRKGVASTLLDSTRRAYASFSAIPKEQAVAWSQPTDSGAILARKWFGMQYGWLVYKD